VHVVVSEKPKRSDVFRLPTETAARLKRIAFQASLDEGRRVTFAEIATRALDALERELGGGKPTAVRKRRKG
jgi:hypothetical protein